MQIDLILDARASAEELLALGQLAEREGISGVWVSSLNDSRDPFTNLSLLAHATSRIHLGPIAVNPYDIHPLRIASAFLTLNELAKGRARVVIGGGGEALQALGIQPLRRVRAVAECVDIIKAAASAQAVNYQGELYRASNCRFGWLEAAAPPIYVAAGQEQMLRMAARVADGIMLSDMPPGPAARALTLLDSGLHVHGKLRPQFWTSVFTAWHVYADRAQAIHEARRWLLLRGIFRPWLLAEFLKPSDVDLVMASKAAFVKAFATASDQVEGVPERVLDALVQHVTLTGTPAQLPHLITRLRHLKSAGLASVALRLYARPSDSIRLIGREVLPALA